MTSNSNLNYQENAARDFLLRLHSQLLAVAIISRAASGGKHAIEQKFILAKASA